MKLVFHGAAKEVGRSCIEVKTQGERYFLDAGIKFREGGFDYPDEINNVPDIDGLFISHAHLDHSGALPMFEHHSIICPIFCTRLTYELSKILLKDSYKIARIRNLHPAYNRTDLKKVAKSVRFINYDREYKHRKVKFTYRNAGHIPGSSMIELQLEGRKLLYTGDFKVKNTELMKGAFTDYKDIDILITETTYGNRGLPDRENLKERFLRQVKEVTDRGGSVLIPVFALGRSQEILILLAKQKYKCPVYYDGLCSKMGSKIIEVSEDKYVGGRKKLESAMKSFATHISSEKKRQKALAKPGIFVTTSGMLQGGPVMSYLKELWHDPKNAVYLTGFQCKRTNGRHLAEEGFAYIDGWRTYVKCKVERFDFSGHSDQEELKEFIRKVNPKRLIFNHGDEHEIEVMADWARRELKCKVYAPRVGEEIEIL